MKHSSYLHTLLGFPHGPSALNGMQRSQVGTPGPELGWGDTFANFRNSVIMQGIAARYAQRQASSEKAKEVGSLMGPYGDFTWGLAQRLMDKKTRRARM